MSRVFTLPSGAEIELRPMTVADENKLAATRGRRTGEEAALDDLLQSCCVGVVTPGPYKGLGQAPTWPDMLQGDRFASLLALRSISYPDGEVYAFRVPCENCKTRINWEVNLLEDLDCQMLSEESAAVFQSGGIFAVQIAGKKVEFRLAFGRDALRYEKLNEQHPDRESSIALEVRIKSVEDVDRSRVLDWLETLTAGEAEQLRDAFDEVDCGYDTDIEIDCRKCGRSFVVPLPFEEFFTVRRSTRRRRRRRSSGGSVRKT